MKGEVQMPSLLIERNNSNFGPSKDILVTPKVNIIMNKIYVQTYLIDPKISFRVTYRLRIRDESTGQIICDVSNQDPNPNNNAPSVGVEVWKSFQDVKMFSGKIYRLNICTDAASIGSTEDAGTLGETAAFAGLSNEHLSITENSSRMFGRSTGIVFPEIRFDYIVDEPKGIRVRSTTTSAKGIKKIAKPIGTQEGDVLILYVSHHSDAVVNNSDGFIAKNTSQYSTMLCKVATNNEPAEYTINITTAQLNWIEMELVAVADAKFANNGMLNASGSAVNTTRVANKFAVIAGHRGSYDNGNIDVLSPSTNRYTKMCASIVSANTNVIISRNGWDSQTKFIILDEDIKTKKIKHIGSKSWSETTSYNGVDGKCTWSVPSGIQIGDLIVVMAQSTGKIKDSEIPSPSGYIKLHEKYGPAGYNGGESGSATFYKIATAADIDSKVTFYTPKNSTGIAFGSINVYRDAKILSSDIVNVTGFNVTVPGNQEEVILLEQVRREYPTPQGGYTRIAKHGYTATTMHQYFYNATTIKGSTDGDVPEYTIPWVLIGYNEGNEPPTKPESFTKQPNTSSMNLSEESVQLEWTASTDPEGDVISYEVELYNGSAWIPMASNVAANSYSATLPKLDTDKAQFRVRAVDSKGGQSDYTLGNVFTIATRLLLIQDNNIVKSFKDGVWKSI